MTENIAKLAQPKLPHPEFVPDKEFPLPVSGSAKKAVCTARSEQLARPQKR